MVDLTREMADLLASIGRPHPKRGRVLMFVSAYGREGTSTVTREFARCEAAFAKRPVWLVDADLKRQSQLAHIGAEPERFGPPGPLSQASPDGSVFYSISPPTRDREGQAVPDSKFLVSRPFLDRRLWVTRFREQNLAPGSRVKIFEQTHYWQALRQHAQTIIVDAPSLEAGPQALQLAPLMDGVILVVSEDTGTIDQRLQLKAEIEAVQGRILGLFYNKAKHAASGASRRSARLTA